MAERSPIHHPEQGMLTPDFHILSPTQFLQRFTQQAGKAQERVWLQSMFAVHGHSVGLIMNKALEAAKRGVDVRAHIDAVSLISRNSSIPQLGGVLHRPNEHDKIIHAQSEAFFAGIQEATGDPEAVIFSNPLNPLEKVLPVIGRNHTKTYFADQTAWFGGVNLTDHAFSAEDLMIETKSPNIVSALEKVFFEVNEARPESDYAREISSETTLLVDAGKRNQSLIYDDALMMAQTTQNELIFISQCVPEGKMLDEMLLLADEGKQIYIITSPETDASISGFPFSIFYDRFRRKTDRNPNISLYHANKSVHAKILIQDRQVISTGSHNFLESGIRLGTQELSLHTTDETLVKQVVNFAGRLAGERAKRIVHAD